MVSTTEPIGAGTRISLVNRWSVATVCLAIILVGPILSVFHAATGDNEGLWQHLSDTVLPGYVANTLVLMAGVGSVSLLFGGQRRLDRYPV